MCRERSIALFLGLLAACGASELEGRSGPFGGRISTATLEPARALVAVDDRIAIAFHLSNRVSQWGPSDAGWVEGAATEVGAGPRNLVRARGTDVGLVAANASGVSLSLLRSSPDTMEVSEVRALNAAPIALAAGDLDGDGIDELAIVTGIEPASTHVELHWLGSAAEPVRRLEAGASAVAIGDVDGDGVREVVVAHEGQGTIAILAAPLLEVRRRIEVCPAPFALSIAMGTIAIACRTGGVDVVAHALEGARVRHLEGGEVVYDVLLADFDADGALDVAAVDRVHHAVLVWMAQEGQFAAASILEVGAGPVALEAIDVGADGDLDLAVLAFEARTVELLINEREDR